MCRVDFPDACCSQMAAGALSNLQGPQLNSGVWPQGNKGKQPPFFSPLGFLLYLNGPMELGPQVHFDGHVSQVRAMDCLQSETRARQGHPPGPQLCKDLRAVRPRPSLQKVAWSQGGLSRSDWNLRRPCLFFSLPGHAHAHLGGKAEGEACAPGPGLL